MTQRHDVEPTDWSFSLAAATPVAESHVSGLVDDILDLLDGLAVPDTVVSEGADDVAVSFTVTATTPSAAVATGVDLWNEVAAEVGIDSWPLVRAEAATYEAIERDFRATALPALVGLAEVAAWLGVSEREVAALQHDDRLPLPIAGLPSGPLWAAAGIEKFIEVGSHQPGVSPRQPATVAVQWGATAAGR